MIDIKNWSRSDVSKYCELTGISCSFKGNGYVVNQSIEKGTIITNETKLEVELNIKEVK